MALFIVLWLLNSSKQVKEAVGGYFKDPTGTSKKVGNGQIGSGENFSLSKDNMEKLKDELQKSVRKINDFDKLKNQIEMTITVRRPARGTAGIGGGHILRQRQRRAQ